MSIRNFTKSKLSYSLADIYYISKNSDKSILPKTHSWKSLALFLFFFFQINHIILRYVIESGFSPCMKIIVDNQYYPSKAR